MHLHTPLASVSVAGQPTFFVYSEMINVEIKEVPYTRYERWARSWYRSLGIQLGGIAAIISARPAVTFLVQEARALLPLGRYQIIQLGDRGTRVWTTCLRLLRGSARPGVSSPTPYTRCACTAPPAFRTLLCEIAGKIDCRVCKIFACKFPNPLQGSLPPDPVGVPPQLPINHKRQFLYPLLS